MITRLTTLIFGSTLLLHVSAHAQKKGSVYQQGYLSKEESLESIEVPNGYKLQLVLSDPIIKEPVAVAWDGNGIMYVAEMRTYMQDADASDEKKPISRISRHEDTDGDGVYDKHSVYIDDMVLPRMILPLDDRIMVGVTDTLDLWTYRDTTGNGEADEKIKIYEGGRRGGNMEHQPSGLVWGLDNWIYLTYEAIRYRFTDGELITEELPQGGGQWGLTQDDDGRFYYGTAGGEKPALFFQQPAQYGMIGVRDELEPDFKKVYPIAPVPDVQGGTKRVGSDGGLNYFTGCAGQEIFRGDNLPDELYGNLFIPEPVGRLIRRAEVTRKDGQTTLSNATPKSEFIRTKDINFRPVQTSTGPDGCLYIVDMHRGIIQQGNWTKPKSYLRGIIDEWGLDKNIGHGRIYRLVHEDHEPGPRPNLNSLTTKELLKHLDHPNSWWRDTAKRLIILRDDRNSVAPLLEQASTDAGFKTQTRITALWTLEGMSAAKPATLTLLLADPDPRIVCNAIRVSESWIKRGDPEVIAALSKLAGTNDKEIAIQLLNSIHYSGNPASLAAIRDQLMKDHDKLPTIAANKKFYQNSSETKSTEETGPPMDPRIALAMVNGRKIYSQLCTECHGENGTGTPMEGQPGVTLAPALTSTRVNGHGDTLIRTLLHGLQGSVDGKEYAAGIMPPQASNDDQWIADVATYVRMNFGNDSSMISPEMVASIRKIEASQTEMWTQKELEEKEPKLLTNQQHWRLRASHGESSFNAAVDKNPSTRYSSGEKMTPDMWLAVGLPSAVNIHRIVMDHGSSPDDFPVEFTVSFSLDGKTWTTSEPAKGTPSVTTMFVPPTKAQYIRINQTGTSASNYWSIHELQLFGK
ncbi:MAG: DUF7133 domain-containing protein [Luteolibacter sp.]